MLSLVLHETEVLLVAESIDSRIDEISDILASADSELNDIALTEHYKCELSALRALYDKIKHSK
nr:MAG TPA: hypothetical protein [Microviridae sp.]